MPDFMDSFRDDSDLQAGLHCLKTLNEIIRSFDMVTFPTLYFLYSHTTGELTIYCYRSNIYRISHVENPGKR